MFRKSVLPPSSGLRVWCRKVDLDVGSGGRRGRSTCEPLGIWVKPAREVPLEGIRKLCEIISGEECVLVAVS
jgi:hypothetical protein